MITSSRALSNSKETNKCCTPIVSLETLKRLGKALNDDEDEDDLVLEASVAGVRVLEAELLR